MIHFRDTSLANLTVMCSGRFYGFAFSTPPLPTFSPRSTSVRRLLGFSSRTAQSIDSLGGIAGVYSACPGVTNQQVYKKRVEDNRLPLFKRIRLEV